MNFKNRIITALGGVPKETNSVRGNDFLRFGNRQPLVDDWKDVKIDDEDVYKGYPYAVIQKRANKVATLARDNLRTWAKPEVVDEYQKHDQDPLHPYLKLIEDSEDFSVKQFWKTICIYLDLAGAFYLGAVRNGRYSRNPEYPNIFGDITKFVLLNPYEIKRVLNSDGKVAGYIETKKDGRQRKWPPYMIIPMREMNPFDWDKVWSMTDAAKEETFTLKQSGNYTRETLNGNLNAPGILTTDVILEDNQFADFISRVRNHTKGEPVFGNGAGAIKWESMQQDLDKAALMDINEINRTALFAVSGTSKTALGIEQSGTTRETARVQTEQFISDTAQPRLEDIIDYLNLDYKRYYAREYKTTGYWIEIESAASRDYATETQATQMRQAQSTLAFDLMQKGYTMQSSYDYAEGKIELSDLELEKGIDKPQDPESTPPDDTPSDAPESPVTDDTNEDDKDTVEETETNNALTEREGLIPHQELLENSKKAESSEEATLDSRHQESNHDCDCGKVEVLINELGEAEGKTLEESYKKFLNDIEEIQKETYKACVSKLTVNSFTEEDIIGERKKRNLVNKLKSIIQNYWWILTPLLANSLMDSRNEEFGENAKFVFTNELQTKIENNASRVGEGHMETILKDVLDTSNKVYTNIMEEKAAELIVKAYKTNTPKYVKYFEEQPSMTEALKAIRNTDILEENRKIYERANELAMQGYKREDIVKAIRNEYKKVSKRRAELIAQNETSRAYSHSQYESDTQFLNSIGQLDTAYKELYSLRPENEKDKICPICEAIINQGPIPFTQNFVSLGETVTAERDGKVYNFLCNYEDIEGGTVHVGCFCRYRLILNGKTLNEATTAGADGDVAPTNGVDNSTGGSRLEKEVNGGKGSGGFGHKGRPDEVGGSAKSEKASSAMRPRLNGVQW